jgi:hypothetical protein
MRPFQILVWQEKEILAGYRRYRRYNIGDISPI